MLFVHLHESYLHNGDNLIIIFKTGKAFKEEMLSPTIINTFKNCKGEGAGGSDRAKKNIGGQMVVAFTTTEVNYAVVSLFYDLAPPLSYILYLVYLRYLVFWLRYLSCFQHSKKAALLCPTSFTILL